MDKREILLLIFKESYLFDWLRNRTLFILAIQNLLITRLYVVIAIVEVNQLQLCLLQ